MRSHPRVERPRGIQRGGTLALWFFQIDAWIRRFIRVASVPRASVGSKDVLENPDDLCRPFIHETKHHKSLHFSIAEVQSRMLKHEPDTLLPDYTRTMMGFLLVNSRPERIAMIGLGGGSLAKFCYRELPGSRIDVVENNPHVLALRNEFHVPPDDDRFHVHLDDGARFIHQSPGQFDVLLVDAYTHEGIPPGLTSQAFYDSCRASLRDNGLMVSNLYCDNAEAHIERIRQSFNGPVFTVEEIEDTNEVVFACASDLIQHHTAIAVPPAHFRRTAWLALKPALVRAGAALEVQRAPPVAERSRLAGC